MQSHISRRTFLKGGMAAACALAASPKLSFAVAHDTNNYLTTVLDIRQCIGCEACVEACREVNQDRFPKPVKPFPKMYPSRVPVADWSDKQDVSDRLTPYNWLYIQHAAVTINGGLTELNVPRRCMHCINPPCVKLCPWGAAKQFNNGIAWIDPDLCLGGSKCKSVCPWEIPERQTGVGLYLHLLPAFAGNGVMYKCDRCYSRLTQAKNIRQPLPACIEACPENVQTIGPRNEMIAKALKLAKDIQGYTYGINENGGTNTIYVSPIPFDQLNQAIETGKGKPHFNPADDAMADANQLASAMLIAPLAGIAAAVGKFYHSTIKKKLQQEHS